MHPVLFSLINIQTNWLASDVVYLTSRRYLFLWKSQRTKQTGHGVKLWRNLKQGWIILLWNSRGNLLRWNKSISKIFGLKNCGPEKSLVVQDFKVSEYLQEIRRNFKEYLFLKARLEMTKYYMNNNWAIFYSVPLGQYLRTLAFTKITAEKYVSTRCAWLQSESFSPFFFTN